MPKDSQAASPADQARPRIRRFTEFLEQAVHDAQHERVGDAEILHFWDDDCLHVPVRGYGALVKEQGRDSKDGLAQALFSAGFLGRVKLLRPHRGEFLGQIATWQESTVSEPDLRLSDLLGDPQVGQILAITQSMSSNQLSDTEIRDALQELRRVDYRAFIQIESMAGAWQERLLRLTRSQGLIDLRAYGRPLSELSQTTEFTVISSELSHLRNNHRPLATAIDAAALASLIFMNRESAEGAARVFPRFFTSSPSLKRLYSRSHWLREQLQFSMPGSQRKGTVWRDGDYYFLRSLFPALRLNSHQHLAEADDEGASLAELQDLVVQLSAAIDAGGREASALVSQYVFKDRTPLSELIDDLERSRMTRIWVTFDQRSLPKDLIESLSLLSLLNRDERASEAALKFEDEIGGRLRTEIVEYRMSTEMVEAVQEKTAAMVKSPSWRGELSLKVDLASVRWGVEYDDARDNIALRSESDGKVRTEVLRDFDIEELRNDPEASKRSMAILLGLEEFELASDLIARVGHQDSSPTHSIMTFVALLGSKRLMSETQLGLSVRYVQEQWELLDDPDRSKLVLGYAYAVFAAWYRSDSGGAWNNRSARDQLGWAAWTIKIVQAYESSLSPIARLYAANHVVYVAASADIAVDGFDSRLLDLERLGVTLDEFRFLDTVGYALLMRVIRASSAGIERPSTTDELRRAVNHLERAVELMPGDIDVQQHLAMARLRLAQG